MLTLSDEGHIPSILLLTGLGLIFLSLLAGLSEQFLSSLAYGQQIKKTDDYYTKKTSDITPPALSRVVQAFLLIAFIAFLSGVVTLSLSLIFGPWR